MSSSSQKGILAGSVVEHGNVRRVGVLVIKTRLPTDILSTGDFHIGIVGRSIGAVVTVIQWWGFAASFLVGFQLNFLAVKICLEQPIGSRLEILADLFVGKSESGTTVTDSTEFLGSGFEN